MPISPLRSAAASSTTGFRSCRYPIPPARAAGRTCPRTSCGWRLRSGSCTTSSAADGPELPLAGNALQLGAATIAELDARARDEIAHGRGHDDLAWSSDCSDARAGVHGDPGDLLAHQLALTRVDAGAHVEAELVSHARDDGRRAPDRPRRPVEARHEAVARGVDLDAAVVHELAAHELVMAREELAPPLVAEPHRGLGRAHEIGEDDRCEHTVGYMGRPHTGQELLDLAEKLLGLSEPGDVRISRELDEARTRDAR